MVVYIRDKNCAECVELPILSNHAFISFGSVLSDCPPYKASCLLFVEYELASYSVPRVALISFGLW